jgi:hypothetical protein
MTLEYVTWRARSIGQMLKDPKLRDDMLKLFVEFGLEHPDAGIFVSRALNFDLAMGCAIPWGNCARRRSTPGSWPIRAR